MKVRHIKKKLYKGALLRGTPFAFKLFGKGLFSFGGWGRDYSKLFYYGAFGLKIIKVQNTSFSGKILNTKFKPIYVIKSSKKRKRAALTLLRKEYYLKLNPGLESTKQTKSLTQFVNDNINKRKEAKKILLGNSNHKGFKPGEIIIETSGAFAEPKTYLGTSLNSNSF